MLKTWTEVKDGEEILYRKISTVIRAKPEDVERWVDANETCSREVTLCETRPLITAVIPLVLFVALLTAGIGAEISRLAGTSPATFDSILTQFSEVFVVDKYGHPKDIMFAAYLLACAGLWAITAILYYPRKKRARDACRVSRTEILAAAGRPEINPDHVEAWAGKSYILMPRED